jgi:predicted metal-binding protein
MNPGRKGPDLKPEVVVHVCVTCRAPGDADGAERPGARLFARLQGMAAERGQDVEIVPVECLSVCKRPCTVGFSGPGKWTYVYGDLSPETSAETILAGAGLYAEAPDGIIPWKARPDALKKGVVARIPPFNPAIAEAAE